MDEENKISVKSENSEQTAGNKCESHFIPDKPTKNDSFGTHKNLANAIKELIISETGGKSIALIGTWGSGKSTVLRIIEEDLPEQIRVFIFDAWAHHEDALRLSFLEKLFYFSEKELKDNGNKVKWEKTTLKEWHKFHENIISSQTKQATAQLGLAIILFTWLIAFYGKSQHNYNFIFDILIIVLCLYLLVRFLIGFLPNERAQALIQSSTTHHETPSTIKFQKKFEELMVKMFQNGKTKKLLIVIDNLDRVEYEEARNIWATMRTFLDYGDQNTPPWLKKVWFLMPFIPEMPKKLYPDKPAGKSEENENNKQRETMSLATAFINKTFQIIFHVPPLVLSDWQKYLIDKLKNIAFPSHELEEFNIIYLLYSSIKVHGNYIPTPRKIILFINEVVAYHKIWNDNIPLVHQAYYVLRKSEFDQDISKIYHGIHQDRNLDYYLESGYKENLASLHTGLEAEKAYQVVLGIPIENSIKTLQFEEFNRLSKKAHNFYGILLKAIEGSFSKPGDANFVINTALCIEKNENNESNQYISNSWQMLASALKNSPNHISNWYEDQRTGEGLVAIIKHSNDKEKLIKIAIGIVNTVKYISPENTQRSAIEGWVKRVYIFLDEINKLGYWELLKDRFSFVNRPNAMFYAYGDLERENAKEDLFELFHPSDDKIKELEEYLVAHFKSEDINEKDSDSITFMQKLKCNWNWDKLMKFLVTEIQIDESNPIRLTIYYTSLFSLKYSGNEKARQVLRDIKLSGYNEYHLFNLRDSLRAASILFFNNFENDEPTNRKINNPDVVKKGQDFYRDIRSNPENHDDLISEFMEIIIKYERVSFLINAWDKNYNKRIVGYVLDNIIDDERVDQIFTKDIISTYESNLRNILGENKYNKFINNLEQKNMKKQN